MTKVGHVAEMVLSLAVEREAFLCTPGPEARLGMAVQEVVRRLDRLEGVIIRAVYQTEDPPTVEGQVTTYFFTVLLGVREDALFELLVERYRTFRDIPDMVGFHGRQLRRRPPYRTYLAPMAEQLPYG